MDPHPHPHPPPFHFHKSKAMINDGEKEESAKEKAHLQIRQFCLNPFQERQKSASHHTKSFTTTYSTQQQPNHI